MLSILNPQKKAKKKFKNLTKKKVLFFLVF